MEGKQIDKSTCGSTVKTEVRQCEYCNKDFDWNSVHSTKKYCSKSCCINSNKKTAKMRAKARKERESNNNNICNIIPESGYIRKQDVDVNELKNIVFIKVQDIFYKKSLGISDSIGGRSLNYKLLGDIPKEIREFVFERDNYECKICKNGRNLHIHHIIKRIDGGSHNVDNLVLLCASCHGIIENDIFDKAVELCYLNAKKYYYNDNLKKEYNLSDTKLDLEDLLNLIIKDKDAEDVLSLIEDIIDNVDNQIDIKNKHRKPDWW